MPQYENQIQFVLNNIAETRRLVFFVGAGISVGAGYPLWSDASKRALEFAKGKGLPAGAAAYATEKLGKRLYYELFQILKDELTESGYYEVVKATFKGDNHASDLHRLLVKIGSRGIITTNFDECLLSACVLERGGPPLFDIQYAMASDDFCLLSEKCNESKCFFFNGFGPFVVKSIWDILRVQELRFGPAIAGRLP